MVVVLTTTGWRPDVGFGDAHGQHNGTGSPPVRVAWPEMVGHGRATVGDAVEEGGGGGDAPQMCISQIVVRKR